MKSFEKLNVTLVNNLKRKIAELNEEKEKFQNIFNKASDGILVADPVSKKFYASNEKIRKMLGYTEEQLNKMNVTDLHPKKDLPYVLDQFEKQAKGIIDIAINLPMQRKDGSTFYVEVNSTPITFNGKTYIAGIFRDITERKQAEEKIKESEEKYRVLYESSSDAIMMIAPPKWNFTEGNPATIKMFNAKDEKEFISKTPGEVSPKYQPDGQLSAVKAKKMIMKAMKAGSNFFEWTHKRITGEDFPATVLLTRIKLNGKEQLQATVRDVTEQKKSEDAIRLKEQSYRLLFDNLPLMVQSVTIDARISYVNKTWKNVLGYSDRDIKKLSLWDIICKSEHAHCKKLFKKVMSGNSLDLINTIFISKTGKTIPVSGTAHPILKNGKVIATDAIFWETKR